MFKSAFKLRLSDPIHKGMATIGYYNGRFPSLTCVTDGGKIFIHSPHASQADGDVQVKYLNLNQEIQCVASGPLDPFLKRDILLVGTTNNLLAYDVEDNCDLFFKDVPDGVSACMVAPANGADAAPASPRAGGVGLGEGGTHAAIVGGNCSVQSFDAKGNELFWTVTGDVVTSMALCHFTKSPHGTRELLVGSRDAEVRVFRNEELVEEIYEVDVVTGLCPIYGSRFGYALANGTVGVYDGASRAWRLKSKHDVCCIASFDLDGDGVEEIVSGWSNGKLEVRAEGSGETLFRDHMPAPVSAILSGDLRSNGKEELICCAADGEVRGYLQAEQTAGSATEDSKTIAESISQLQQLKLDVLQVSPISPPFPSGLCCLRPPPPCEGRPSPPSIHPLPLYPSR